jgi:hypothetical protein
VIHADGLARIQQRGRGTASRLNLLRRLLEWFGRYPRIAPVKVQTAGGTTRGTARTAHQNLEALPRV